jgi:hypothetical protein
MLPIIENYVKNEQNYVTIIEIKVKFIRQSQISYFNRLNPIVLAVCLWP